MSKVAPNQYAMYISKGQSVPVINNSIQEDFIQKLYDRYEYNGETIYGNKIKITRVSSSKGESKSSALKAISADEYIMEHNRKDIEQNMKERLTVKINKLDIVKQSALFMLLESNYCYGVWQKSTFMNYLLSHKKEWSDNKQEGKGDIEAQLNYFKQYENTSKKGNNEPAPILNEYFLRLIFIDNMLKSIGLFSHLSMINKQFKEEATEEIEEADEDKRFIDWGVKQSKKSKNMNGGCLTERGYKLAVAIAFSAFLWSIVTNNAADRVKNFIPESMHLANVNFQGLTPRLIDDMTETNKEFTKIMLEFTDVGGVKSFEESIIIEEKMKARNLEHLENLNTKLKVMKARYKQMKGIVAALPLPEDMKVNEDNGLVTLKDAGDPTLLEQEKQIRQKLDNQVKEAEIQIIELSNKIGESKSSGAVPETAINVSYGQITQMVGESPWSMITKTAQDKKTNLIRDLEVRIIKAFGRDSLNIVNKKILASYKPPEGANDGILSTLCEQASSLVAYVWYGKDSRYVDAPGLGDNLDQARRRSKLIRKTGRQWAENMEQATENFVKDILIHMRNTSYYLWIYSVMQYAIELWAVRKAFKYLKGSTESNEDPDGGADTLVNQKWLRWCERVGVEGVSKRITEMEKTAGNIGTNATKGCWGSDMGNKGSRCTVKGIKYFFGALIVRGIFEGARVSVNTALSNPPQEEVFPIGFSEAFRPADGWEPTATSTGDIFQFDTRIPKGGKAPPKFDATREGFKESKDVKEDDIDTIYLYDIPDEKGVMVGYNYELIKDAKLEKDEPKYRIFGYEYSKMPLEKQLADIRRKNDPQISKPPGLLARGKSTGGTEDFDTTTADVNRGKQRTSNSISINPPPEVVLKEGSVEGKDFEVPHGNGADKQVVAKGGKKIKRKRKKTRRKKRKGGRKKTKKKRKRKKTRRKRKKLGKNKTRRKR